jgi:hypothetical protein
MKDIGRIRDLLKGRHATAFNIVYLQDEVYKFKVHEDGKEWSIYGSPVRLNYKFKRTFLLKKIVPQWSPEFCDWAFNYNREAGEGLLSTLYLHTPSHINSFEPPALVENFPKTDIL